MKHDFGGVEEGEGDPPVRRGDELDRRSPPSIAPNLFLARFSSWQSPLRPPKNGGLVLQKNVQQVASSRPSEDTTNLTFKHQGMNRFGGDFSVAKLNKNLGDAAHEKANQEVTDGFEPDRSDRPMAQLNQTESWASMKYREWSGPTTHSIYASALLC